MEKRKVEILAPAGSFASMKAAVAAGADAVYMGGSRFGARAYAENPDEKGLLEAIDYVHLHGRRLYMTVNTLFKENELKDLEDYMRPYYDRGLDGVIVQDLGAMAFMREHFPGLELHSSTQMTVTSVYGAALMKDLGCSRVVTAREMSLEEIRRIHEQLDIEIESFVHGALCYCYSGQCLMSSLIGGRSGNRGRCAQPCRLPYGVYDPKKEGNKPLNKASEKHVLSLKDLCTLDILPDIIEAGVYSLKIEGRMKSPRYTAGVVSVYRKYVDRYLEMGRKGYEVDPKDRRMLLDLFDRGGFTEGYYTQHNGRNMTALKEKPEFREGNQPLFDYLDQTYVESEIKEPVSGWARLREGEEAYLSLSCRNVKAEAWGQIPQAAKNQPMSEEKVRRQLGKTGGTPFFFEDLSIDIQGNLFFPVQALNELRRECFQKLEEELIRQNSPKRGEGSVLQSGPKRGEGSVLQSGPECGEGSVSPNRREEKQNTGEILPPSFSAYLEEPCQLAPVLSRKEISLIYLEAGGFGSERWKESVDRCHQAGKQCWIALPQIFRSHAERYFKKHRNLFLEAGFDGVLIRALEEVVWLKNVAEEGGKPIPYGLDACVYNWNSRCVAEMKELGASFITMPWELTSGEMEPVLKECRRRQMGGELIIYGHAPMMVSAQCVAKTVEGCTHRPHLLMMKDRTGALLPVKNHCDFCYNTIYNPSPLSLLGMERQVGRLDAERLRFQFTKEDGPQTEAVLHAFIESFVYGRTGDLPFKDFTRGHFKRGVE